MTEKLKSCPFCGGEAQISNEQYKPTRTQAYFIECTNCLAASNLSFNLHDVIKEWNTRFQCLTCAKKIKYNIKYCSTKCITKF